MNTTTYKNADEAWEAGNEWVQETNWADKLEFLMETASPEFKDTIINEMVRWIGDYDFNKFFNHLRRHWDVKTPQELEFETNS